MLWGGLGPDGTEEEGAVMLLHEQESLGAEGHTAIVSTTNPLMLQLQQRHARKATLQWGPMPRQPLLKGSIGVAAAATGRGGGLSRPSQASTTAMWHDGPDGGTERYSANSTLDRISGGWITSDNNLGSKSMRLTYASSIQSPNSDLEDVHANPVFLRTRDKNGTAYKDIPIAHRVKQHALPRLVPPDELLDIEQLDSPSFTLPMPPQNIHVVNPLASKAAGSILSPSGSELFDGILRRSKGPPQEPFPEFMPMSIPSASSGISPPGSPSKGGPQVTMPTSPKLDTQRIGGISDFRGHSAGGSRLSSLGARRMNHGIDGSNAALSSLPFSPSIVGCDDYVVMMTDRDTTRQSGGDDPGAMQRIRASGINSQPGSALSAGSSSSSGSVNGSNARFAPIPNDSVSGVSRHRPSGDS